MNRSSLSVIRIAAAAVLLNFASFIAHAQSTGSIQGTLRDTSGASISHARIEITSKETGLLRTTESDSTGVYAAASLPPGVYTVTVHAAGMTDVRQENVVLSVGHDVPLNFSLTIAEANTTVVINAGESTALDTTAAAQSQTLTPTVVQEVPLNGRPLH